MSEADDWPEGRLRELGCPPPTAAKLGGLGGESPRKRLKVSMVTVTSCGDCPIGASSYDESWCQHPSAPALEASALYDSERVPAKCPLREHHLVVRVSGL